MSEIQNVTIHNYTASRLQSLQITYLDGSQKFVPNDPDNLDYADYVNWAPGNTQNITTVDISF